MAKSMHKGGAKQEAAKTGELEPAGHGRAPSPFEEMDRFFEGVFPRGWMRPFRWSMPAWSDMAQLEGKIPQVDVIDRAGDIMVKAAVPGVEKKDLDISVTDHTVTIKGTTSHESKEEKGDYYRSEISRGSFSRTVALPGEVDADKARAVFKDGMLELTLPKRASSKRHSVKVE